MQRNVGVIEEGDSEDDHDIDVGLLFLHLNIPSFEELRVHLRPVTQSVPETGEVGGAFVILGAYGDHQMSSQPLPESEAGDQEITHSIVERVHGSEDIVPNLEELVSNREELVPNRREIVSNMEELVPNRDEIVLNRDEEAPREEEHIPTVTHTEATAPTSSSPYSVDTSAQSNTCGINTPNSSDNTNFVLEMHGHGRKLTPASAPQQVNGVASVPPATSPIAQQQNGSTESNRAPSVKNNVKEPNADRQTR